MAQLQSTSITGSLIVTGGITGSFSGSIASPGSNTQVLFNNSGVISANSGFVYSGGNVLIGASNNYTRVSISNGNNTRTGLTLSDGDTASLMLFAGASSLASISFDTYGLRFVGGSTAGTDNGTEFMRINTSGNVGIGTTSFPSSTYKFVVRQGTDRILAIAEQSSDLSIEAYNDAQNANVPLRIYSSKFQLLNGDVGIGTTSPTTLSNYKTLTLDATSGTFTEYRQGGTNLLRIGVDGSRPFLYGDSNAPLDFFTNASFRMRLAANGDLLVGTQTSIHGTSGRGVIQINGSSTAILSLSTGDTNAGYIYHTGTDMYLWNYKNGILAFGTNNTERVTILAGGNVGIGITNPSYKLHVYDTSSGNARILVQGTSNYALLQTTNSSGTIYIGIDNSSGSGFGQGAYSRVFYSEGNYPLAISTNGTEKMRILSGGNVGIGTTSPAQKLHVVGNTAVTGITSTGDRKLSLGILDLNSGGTPTQIRINTTIPFNSPSADFTVNIKGFRYGAPQMVSLSIGWHYYLSSFYNETAISNGAWKPTISLAQDAGGYVVIHLSSPSYWPKLYVESVYSSAYGDIYSSGWNWTDADLSNCTNVEVVPYQALATDITGNAGSTSAVSGTTNYVSKFTSATTIGNSQIFDNGTNVGIGTTSPQEKLSVDGGSIRFNYDNASANYYLYLNRKASQDGGILLLKDNTTDWQITNEGSGGDLRFYSYGISAFALSMIKSTGNIGIGTTSPNAKLHIAAAALGTSTNDYVLNSIHYNSNGNSEELEIKSVRESAGNDWTYGGKRIQLRIDSTYMGYMQFNGYGNNAGISFGTGTTTSAPGNVGEKMRITAGGNVGIGTTNPNYPLHISRGDSSYTLYGPNATWGAYLITGAGPNAISNGTCQVISTNGNLHLDSGTAQATYINAYSQTTTFINPDSGNVGIGSYSATEKLDVRGVVRISRSGVNDSGILAFGNYLSGAGYYDNGIFRGALNTPGTAGNLLHIASYEGLVFTTSANPFGSQAIRMFINGSNGYVGIGTTNPGQKLQVEGSLLVNTGTSATAFRDIMLGGIGGWSTGESHGIDTVYNTATSPTTFSRIESHFDGTNGKIRFRNLYNNSSPRTDILMTIQGNGNVGIGTDNPANKFVVSDNGGIGLEFNPNYLSEAYIASYNRSSATYTNLNFEASNIFFRTGASATLRGVVDSSGNFGIGTTSPAFPLDVNGSANVKGSITGQDSSNNYRYEFAPELAYTRVGVGGVGTYKINSGAVSTTSMLRIKSTSTSGWLSSQANYFNGTVISDGLCDVAISTVGTLLFLNTNGEWGIADADVAAKSVTLLGIALNSTSGVGETVDVLIDGIIALKSNHDQISIPASPGAPLYVSTNAGNVTEVAPSGTGDIVRLVGHNVWSATSPQNTAIIRFQPDNTWIEL